MKHVEAVLAAALLLTATCAPAAERGAADLPAPSFTIHEDLPRSIELPVWYERPAVPGRLPLVMIFHGCSGLPGFSWRRAKEWGALFRAQGYATLIVDSFTPRGLGNVCSDNERFTPAQRAIDVLVAAAVMAERPDIDAQRIAVIGFSHGGGTVLDAVAVDRPALAAARARLAARGRITAAIGMYPGCRATRQEDFATPLLILVGEKDDWTPAHFCQELAARPHPGLRLEVLPGATHDFDVEQPPRVYLNHAIAYDAAAAQRARELVLAFLKDKLR